MDAQRAILDQLMGKGRNLREDERAALAASEQLEWRDPQVCPFFLAGLCPHDLFTNTHYYLGPCKKKHDEKCREDFQKESQLVRYPIEHNWIKYVEDQLIRACDRRAVMQREKVGGAQTAAAPMAEIEKKIEESEEIKALNAKQGELSRNIAVLEMQIEATRNKAPDAVAPLQKLVDGLKDERLDIDVKRNECILALNDGKPLSALAPAASAMGRVVYVVCDVCASQVRADETPERLKDHREGKVHTGFERIRAKVSEFQNAHKKAVDDGVMSEEQMKEALAKAGATPGNEAGPAAAAAAGGRYERGGRDGPPSSGAPWRGGHTQFQRGGGGGGYGYGYGHRPYEPRDNRYDDRARDRYQYERDRERDSHRHYRDSDRDYDRHSRHHSSSHHRSSHRSSRSRSPDHRRSRHHDRDHDLHRHRSSSHRSSSRSSRHKRHRSSSRSSSPSPSPSPSRSRSRSRSRSSRHSSSHRRSSKPRHTSRSRSRSGSRHRSSRRSHREEERDKEKEKEKKSENGTATTAPPAQ